MEEFHGLGNIILLVGSFVDIEITMNFPVSSFSTTTDPIWECSDIGTFLCQPINLSFTSSELRVVSEVIVSRETF